MNRKVLYVVMLCVSLFFTGCNRKVRELQKKNSQLMMIIKEYEAENKSLSEENSDLKRKLDQAELKIRLLENKNSELMARKEKLSQDLINALKRLPAATGGQVTVSSKGIVTVTSEVLFGSGKATLTPRGKKVLDKIIEVIKNRKEIIRIDGHTDNQPIRYSGFKDNWHLSGARARTVLNYLIKKGINPKRLYFAGFSYYRPIASNKTAAGRAKNRRVEIKIIPSE